MAIFQLAQAGLRQYSVWVQGKGQDSPQGDNKVLAQFLAMGTMAALLVTGSEVVAGTGYAVALVLAAMVMALGRALAGEPGTGDASETAEALDALTVAPDGTGSESEPGTGLDGERARGMVWVPYLGPDWGTGNAPVTGNAPAVEPGEVDATEPEPEL